MGLPAFRAWTRAWVCGAALAAAAAEAQAADLAPQLNLGRGYSWQGPYVGANLGFQWGSTTGNPTRPSGAAGGLSAGYNIHSGPFVLGLETDIQLSSAEDRFAPWKFSNPWFGTLRGRGGYALNNILFYGTLGLAYGTLTAENTVSGVSQSNTGMGWAAGGGMEVGLTNSWTARAEYLYIDLNDRPFGVTGTSNGLQSHLLRLGISFRF